jgi:hypothetical protein
MEKKYCPDLNFAWRICWVIEAPAVLDEYCHALGGAAELILILLTLKPLTDPSGERD